MSKNQKLDSWLATLKSSELSPNFWRTQIKPSHLLADPEFRQLYRPHDVVTILPETLIVETPKDEIPIVLVVVRLEKDPQQTRSMILEKLSLTKAQRKCLSRSNLLPNAYFKRINSLTNNQDRIITGCYLVEDGEEEMICSGVNATFLVEIDEVGEE